MNPTDEELEQALKVVMQRLDYDTSQVWEFWDNIVYFFESIDPEE